MDHDNPQCIVFFYRGFKRFALELEGDNLQSVAKLKDAVKMKAPSWSWKVGTMLKGSVLNLFLGKRKTLHPGATRVILKIPADYFTVSMRNFMQSPRLPCSQRRVEAQTVGEGSPNIEDNA